MYYVGYFYARSSSMCTYDARIELEGITREVLDALWTCRKVLRDDAIAAGTFLARSRTRRSRQYH